MMKIVENGNINAVGAKKLSPDVIFFGYSGFAIPSNVVEDLKSSFNSFGIANPKEQRTD